MKKLIYILAFFPIYLLGQNGATNGNVSDCLIEDFSITQIRNLKNAGTLDAGCTYAAVRNFGSCIGEVTIYFKAISESELNRDVTVQRLTETYAGRYETNLNNAGFLELKDSRGNEVKGNAAIIRFPWGDVQVLNTKVSQNAIWTCDCNVQYNHRDNIHDGDSNVDTRGLTSGYIYSTEFHNSVNVDFDNVGSLLCDDSYYSGIGNHDFSSYPNVRQLRVTSQNGYQYATGGTRYWIDRTNISSFGTIRNDGAVFTMYYGNVHGNATVDANSGTLTSQYSTYENRARVNHNATGTHYDLDQTYSRATSTSTGTSNNYNYYGHSKSLSVENCNNSFCYDYTCTYGEGSAITTTNATRVNSYYERIVNGGIRSIISVPGTSYCYRNFISGSTARADNKTGTVRFYNFHLVSASEVRSTGGGNNFLYRMNASGNSQQYYTQGISYDNVTQGSGRIDADNGAFTVRYSFVLGNYTQTVAGNVTNKFRNVLSNNW